MVGALHHRGPDGAGVASCAKTQAVIGSTRLALLDDDGGAQPWHFGTYDGASAILVFNGELYNHPELAAALTTSGAAPPRSSCDTETLARGWQTVGASIWSQLDGMFAAAIVEKGELVLARDPHGQKPLFIWREAQGRALAFASEVGALLAEKRVHRHLDAQSVVEWGAIGFPLRDDALLAGVRSLPPGHELRVRVGSDGRLHETQRDFRADTRERSVDVRLPDPRGKALRSEDPIEALATALPNVVSSHARADHPVGLFLSGGLDSGLLAALMVEHGTSPVHTFTMADDPTHPDLVAAREFAAQIGTFHHERIVSADDMELAWPLTVAAQGLPLAPTVAELGGDWARQWVKAVLVGDGADELFAGYRYHQVPRRTIGSMAEGYNRMVRRGAVPLGAGDRLRAELQSLKSA
ncbi:MAG: asparagine synthase-related protein, partial [Pseudomonadota bacterium]